MLAGIAGIGAGVLDAIRSVMTCEPNHLIMGMSAVTFMGGARGADANSRKRSRKSPVCAARSERTPVPPH
jgi:hypothetical protein